MGAPALTYGYDKDRKSQTTTFSFDSLNRITGAQFQDNSTIGYVYDSKGRIQYINDSISGQISRTYDNLDLLLSEQTPLGTVSYVNDGLGRRSSMTTPGQTALTYGYDSGDRLNQITQGSTSVSMTYDTAGRRSTLTLPNGIVATYGYDTSSRLASINYDKSGTHVGDLSYAYDNIGRRTSMGGTMARANLPAGTTASAIYNVNNQLTSWNGTTLSYDLNGNMSNDGIRAFSWNARNQLASIGTTTFQYDGTGRRSQNGAGVGFVYDGLNPVQEIVGGTPRANLLTGGLDEFFARTDSGGTSSFLTDALGSTLALADSTGTVQTQYTFDPFGNTTSTGASSTNAFQYTGRENDGSGMYYYRARYYNPTLGRFISEDPIGFGGGQINLYGYVGNDPLGFVDPSGNNAAVGAMGVFGTFVGASQFIPGWDVVVDTALLAGSAVLAGIALAETLDNAKSTAGAKAESGTLSGRKPPPEPDDKCKDYNDAKRKAGDQYQNKAGRPENHHIQPKYLGGPEAGPFSRIDAAYHQLITNAFRMLAPYNTPRPPDFDPTSVMRDVYNNYPLPPAGCEEP